MNEEEDKLADIVENVLNGIDNSYRSDYHYAIAKGVVSFFDDVGAIQNLRDALNE